MLVLDTERLQRASATEQLEAYEDRVNRWTAEVCARGVVVPGDSDTPLNPHRQTGRALTHSVFEKLIAALSPSLYTDVHPANSYRGVVWQVTPGERQYVTAYDRALVPEFSVFRGYWVWEADPDYRWKTLERSETTGNPVTLQQADDLLRRLGKAGALAELKKRAADADPDRRPGQVKRLKLAGEAIRGWRTVLAVALQKGACTLGDIERTLPKFGLPVHADNASWALATGRQQVRCGF